MTDPEFCVTCGRLIPLPERAWPVRFVKQLYCSGAAPSASKSP